MVVGVMRLEVSLAAAFSLKEKRGQVRRLLGRCRSRFPVSCAETGLHDVYTSCELGFSAVEHSEGALHRLFERVQQQIELSGEVEITACQTEYLHYN